VTLTTYVKVTVIKDVSAKFNNSIKKNRMRMFYFIIDKNFD